MNELDKAKLFHIKNSILRNTDMLNLRQIGVGEYFEKLFYRGGELHLQEEGYEHFYDKHYNALVMTIIENDKGRKIGKNHIVTRELNLPDRIWSCDMAITSPITYVGRNRNAKNARLCYGLAIDLDGVGEKQLFDILHQQSIGYMPRANIIVNSGNGVHLYFLFAEPIALFDETKRLLGKLKHAITERCWNMNTSSIKEKQIQGIFQGFRIPETRTKFGEKVTCFVTDELDAPLYHVRDLQHFGPEHLCLSDAEVDFLDKAKYFPDKLSLNKAKELYPDWYERRIVRGERKGRWHIKRDLYDWWLRRLKAGDEVKEGHRYFCMMALAMYALKCDIPLSELSEDAYKLIDEFDSKTVDPENRFVKEDAEDALKAYQENYATFPRDTIAKITGLSIKVNKRNKRPQGIHLKLARGQQAILCEIESKDWRNKNGRPKGSVKTALTAPKAMIIQEWRKSNPNGSRYACIKETGISKPTVYKWWDGQE